MSMSRTSGKTTKSSAERKKYIASRRRKQWGKDCGICGDRWHGYKWSVFHEGSNVCTGCLQYLNNIAKRGGAWIARRLILTESWAKRLGSVARSDRRSKRGGLRAVK